MLSIVIQKSRVYVWCKVWHFLAVAKSLHASTLINQLANLYHGFLLSNVGYFCTLIVLHYPICEGDYVYSMKVG